MPSIARSTRQVKETATAFGGNNTRGPQLSSITPALNHAVGVVNQIGNQAIKWQEEADNTELTAFKTKLRNQQNKALHDKDSGFTKVKGKNAAESYGDYKDGYDKFVSTELGNLSSRLQDKAHLIGESHKVDLDNQLNVHTGREMENHADGVFTAGLESMTNHAVSNAYETKGRIGAVIEEQQAAIDLYAARKGMDPDQVLALNTKAASNLHSKVMKQFINNGDDLLAKDYLQQATERGEISGDDAPGLNSILRASSIKGESQRVVDKIMSENLGLGESLAATEGIKDPSVRDATRERLRRRWTEKDLIKKDETERMGLDLAKQIETAGIDSILPTSTQALSKSEMKLLTDYSDKYIAKGFRPTTNPVVLQELKLQAANTATRAKFLETNLLRYVTKLSPGDMNSLRVLKDKIRKGDSKADKEMGRFMADTKIISNVTKSLKISSDADKADFESAVMAEANRWEIESGKKIPNSELESLAYTMGMKLEVEGATWFNDPDKRLFQVEPTERIKTIEYSSIPRASRFKIQEYLNKKGISYTEAEALKLYKLSLTK